MARRQRNSLSGATYHVMLRGNGQSFFSNDEEGCKLRLLLQERSRTLWTLYISILFH